ncbi:uncharacterized protein [Nicotiana tomentosiformis]|uniref:uncharacterized protein n=1 Tax=Nicotiana tomentosiformis TaxID=4098 RepID=UPI00388C692A
MELITRVCRIFLWTGSHRSSRRALVTWETLCKPHLVGGLNFIEFHTWNMEAISKLLWAVTTKNDALWINWIHTFYIKGKELQQLNTHTQACWLVRKILDAKKWFLNMDYNVTLQSCCDKDKFSIKKTYLLFLPHLQKVQWKGLVLGPTTIPKHKFIIWLALLGRLATVDRLHKWGIHVQTDCVLCTTRAEKNLQHLFFQCPYSSQIWSALLRWLGENRRISNSEEKIDWISKKMRNNRPRAEIMKFLCAAIVYHVWNERNARRFQAEKKESQ